MMKKSSSKKKKIKPTESKTKKIRGGSSQSVLTIILLSFGAFLLCAVVSFFMPSSFERSNKIDDSLQLKYTWGTSEDDLANPEIWKLPNNSTGIGKPLGKSIIRINGLLSPTDKPQVLTIVTQNNPIKVLVNGNEIYNNGYDDKNVTFVGNRTNAVKLDAINDKTKIDIYAKAPLGFSFAAKTEELTTDYIYSAVSSGNVFKYNASMLFGGVLILSGLIILMLNIILSVRNKNMGKITVLAFMIIAVGALLIVDYLSYNPKITTSYRFKIELAVSFIVFLLYTGITASAAKAWNKFLIGDVVFSGLLIVVLFIIRRQLTEVVFIVAEIAVVIITTVAMSSTLITKLSDEIEHGKMLVFSYMFISFTYVYDSINLVLGFSNPKIEIKYVALIVYAIMMLNMLFTNAVFINIRKDERAKQISRDSAWIEQIMEYSSEIFRQKNEKSFFKTVANSMVKLIANDVSATEQNKNLKYCVGVKSKNEYSEILNEGKIPNCNYKSIEKAIAQNGNSKIFYSSTYLDMEFVSENNILAIIHIENLDHRISESLINLINITHSNISISLENFKTRKEMENLEEKVFIDLAEISEQKSLYTGEHLYRVREYVRVLAEEMGIDKEKAILVGNAAMVHDIGKLAIPENILEKKGTLTDEEYSIMKDHVFYGNNMLSKSSSEFMKTASVIAYQHHEKYDGTGYLKIKGDDINPYARITTVADVFDALLSQRSYKEAWTSDKAYEYINNESGKSFDPQVVNAFNRCFDKLKRIHGKV